MKIFVCEFVTGGGLYRDLLPSSLVREGMMMRDALLHDLAELKGVAEFQGMEIRTTHDIRLPVPQHVDQSIPVDGQADVWQLWSECILNADAIWPIAPETGGALSRLTGLVTSHGKTLLGSSLETVNLTTSKHATYQTLQAAGIPTVPTYTLHNWPKNDVGPWVAKQDNGAGCENSGYFESSAMLHNWMEQGRETSHIIQPYQPGIPSSISMLCNQGRAWLLSSNRQKITLESGKFIYTGSIVNGMAACSLSFEAIAKLVAKAFPGLSGYVGVDLIVDGDQIYVLEINPRLTTSYAGLYEATGLNPARLIMDLTYNKNFCFPSQISRNTVEIALNG